jgi:hypothetical protein
MKVKTIIVFVIIIILLFIIIRQYCNNYYRKTIESIQYGLSRLPSPFTIYNNQLEETPQEENFSQIMQDELSTIGSYKSKTTLSKEFEQCVSVCDEKMNRCIAAGNPVSCEYNYRICRQDCKWTTR